MIRWVQRYRLSERLNGQVEVGKVSSAFCLNAQRSRQVRQVPGPGRVVRWGGSDCCLTGLDRPLEIGQITGVGRETVKSRLRYAIDKLRLRLKP